MAVFLHRARAWLRRLFRTGLWLGLGLALVGVQWPATWLDAVVYSFSGQRLTLANASGTLWRGHGELYLLMPDGTWLALASPAWAWQPAALARGELSWQFELASPSARTTPPLILRFDLAGISLEQLAITLPAAVLGAGSDTLRAAQLGGEMALTSALFRITRAGFSGDLQVVWHDAQSAWAPGTPLGTYTLRCHGQQRRLVLAIDTRNGNLVVTGNGSWQPGQLPQFTLNAQPTVATHAALQPLLRVLGRRTGESRYQIHLDANAGIAGSL